jgi:predicted MPP superfamily phosphohydrolase
VSRPIRPVRVARYAPQLADWPAALALRIVVLTDFHACEPFMNEHRMEAICAQANGLHGDIVLLLGDYLAGPRFSRPPSGRWAKPLRLLSAPLGVHAVLGNHDYTDPHAGGAKAVEDALLQIGIEVYINRAVRLEKDGQGFWLAGLGDQYALRLPGQKHGLGHGVDDLDGTLAQVTTAEPVVMMAHEPDIFATTPPKVSLVLSGHNHAGQIRVFKHAPVVPSRFGQRYLHGHVVEDARHLIVSSGLGYSGLPIRIGAPPEIVVVELGATAAHGV